MEALAQTLWRTCARKAAVLAWARTVPSPLAGRAFADGTLQRVGANCHREGRAILPRTIVSIL